ncbi:putative ABC transporter permease protein [Sporomusa silvacetica DSM 10669]|uniref:ABC transporter permease protein n=1 Tax=Sporomusa silvacetica DSM 10669 TaxID=1123289 RepID=A0ABZ3IRM5_9FIRM|nr:iron ABC transporter permease [Sporomusa silvacetica]OZC20829.1 putative ABC transporter permease protein [Sporomusa silvacetica DSM 10669]
MKWIRCSEDTVKLISLLIALLTVFFISFMVGRYPIAPDTALGILAAKIMHITPFWTPNTEIILFKIRLPRIIAAMLVGAALSAAGAAYQGMFRNPMVSPDILGVTAGASFGAAIAILLSWSAFGIQLSAYVFGLIAVLLTYGIATWLGKRGDTVLMMILAGIIIGMLFASFVSLTKFVADPENTLPAITYWLLGSLASASGESVYITAIPILLGLMLLLALRWNLNVISFGDEEAKALGVNVTRLRFFVILAATLITSAAVSISGIISMVGLVVPHLSRMIVGPNNKILLPASVVMGAIFLLLVDDFARTLFSVEVPLGILTSIIGAPFFIYLLYKTRKG